MRIGFAAPPVPGHLNPMIALATQLKSRGHQVVFFGVHDAGPALRAVNMPFVPYGAEQFPPGNLTERLAQLSRLSGAKAWQFTLQQSLDTCRAALQDGPRVVRDSQIDALVLDTAQRGFDLLAMHLRVPYVHVSNALHLDYSGHTPLAFYDWPHEDSAAALARNRQGIEMFRQTIAPLTNIQQEYAEQVGLKLDWDDLGRSISRRAWLSQTPKEFDFPSNHWPEYFHHVGPLQSTSARAPVKFPWERLSGEPLIYASMGTLQNGSEGVFRKIVEGAEAPGPQLVLSIGENLDPDQIGTVRANTILVKWAPQIELLRRATVCITHAGVNTVLESLAQGVPMVAIPVSHDHPGVGARITYTKAGIVIPFKELTAERLRGAVAEVTTNPIYRENAQRLQAAIQATNALDVAANLIESALRT